MRAVPRVALFSVLYLRSCGLSTYGAIHLLHSDSIFHLSLRSKVCFAACKSLQYFWYGKFGEQTLQNVILQNALNLLILKDSFTVSLH